MENEALTKTAMQLWERDNRFRMIVQSSVVAAMDKHGRVDPERADREAHDIALEAGILIATQILEGDAELKAARMERDHYKALAERAIRLSPSPPMILKTIP